MDLIQQLKTPDNIVGYAESRIGGRSENQDSYGYSDTPFGWVVTVCDGMGGGPGGKTASSIAVTEIIQGIKEGNKEDIPSNIVIKAIRRANISIIEAGKRNPDLKGMGSTCTVLLINQDSAVVAHVGDSRVYQLRGKTKVFRTFDHSMVFDLVKQKVITEEQARLSAQSNVITRALGIKNDIEVDTEIRPYEEGDRFLLTSDGIHGSIPERELIDMVADKHHTLGTIVDNIATTVDGKGLREGGGHDNLTIALIETKSNSILREKMNKNTKILLGSISIVCLLSLIFNFVQLSHSGSPETNNDQINQVDSLQKKLTETKDQLSKKVEEMKAEQENHLNTQSTSTKRISELEERQKKLEDENVELRKELDKYKNKEKK
ncbi:MAG: protein phosphatase 2C domain-containing protein [Muribaculaceae bacterium]|nr:protein phosphatase 2C domain-containing protein [Muribaculaceae bacterium]MDD6701560.1 protein phosphatase 2C domain-containing protein [Bacteroidales bacterium]